MSLLGARSVRGLGLRAARLDLPARLGAGLLAVIIISALSAPVLAPVPLDARSGVHPLEALQPPSLAHPFGTDQVGRDVLTRVLYGGRTSLLVVLAVLGPAAVVGLLLGVIAGYVGGRVRDVIMRLTDVVLAFPPLLLSLALVVVLGPSLPSAVLAIAVTWWPWYARLTAGLATSVRSRTWVDAARALGVGPWRTAVRHVLPHCSTPILVQLSLDAGGVLLTASALSYLGLGAQEPTSEWGSMVAAGQSLFTTDWWVVTFPGLAIVLTALACNLLGEGLRVAFDPRAR